MTVINMRSPLAVILLCSCGLAHARDLDGRYAQAPYSEWYLRAETTLRSRDRIGFVSCCAHSDVVKTRFRPTKTGDDGWEYIDASGEWARVPDDIIHIDGQTSPTGEPVLFALNGRPVCFFIPQGGL